MKTKTKLVKKYNLASGKPGAMMESFKAKKTAVAKGKMHGKAHGKFTTRHKMTASC